MSCHLLIVSLTYYIQTSSSYGVFRSCLMDFTWASPCNFHRSHMDEFKDLRCNRCHGNQIHTRSCLIMQGYQSNACSTFSCVLSLLSSTLQGKSRRILSMKIFASYVSSSLAFVTYALVTQRRDMSNLQKLLLASSWSVDMGVSSRKTKLAR
ncbi:hypothetical protein F4814DRAFT_183326 [Daldinia grandis]|nr:hypothetical protein F4814DRAFT_183326 [Daldinia grandis]